jgi:predicted CopG family antitoxin
MADSTEKQSFADVILGILKVRQEKTSEQKVETSKNAVKKVVG